MTTETSGESQIEQQNADSDEIVNVLGSEDPSESPQKKTYADYVKASESEDKPADETPVEAKPEKSSEESDLEKAQKQYDELRKKFSQQGNELGELRKLFTKKLEQELDQQGQADNSSEPAKEITADDLLEEPVKAVSDAFKQTPEYKELQELKRTAKEAAASADLNDQLTFLNDNYGDWEAATKDGEFRDWASQNPHRIEKFNKANAGDMKSLLDIVDAYHAAAPDKFENVEAKAQVVEQERQSKLQAAKTGRGGAKAPESKGPKFRRKDLVQLQLNNPEKYKRMLPEIVKAYAAKRVI